MPPGLHDPLTPGEVAQIRQNLGLDRPLTTQYLDWLWNVLRGNFGRSLVDQTSVSGQIFSRLPATLELTGTALVLGLLIAVPIGLIQPMQIVLERIRDKPVAHPNPAFAFVPQPFVRWKRQVHVFIEFAIV